MRIYKSIDKAFKKNLKPIAEMFNNLISGILAGTIIYYMIKLNATANIINWILYAVFLIILGFIGIIIMTKNTAKEIKKTEKENYFWNIIMALLGTAYLLAIFQLNLNKIISSITLILLFVIISYLRTK